MFRLAETALDPAWLDELHIGRNEHRVLELGLDLLAEAIHLFEGIAERFWQQLDHDDHMIESVVVIDLDTIVRAHAFDASQDVFYLRREYVRSG